MLKTPLLILLAAFTSSTSALAAPSYSVSLATPVSVEQVISSDRLWSCNGATCLAGGEATSPAKHICSRIAKQIGPVTAFNAQGRSFSADEIAACNGRAGHTLAPVASK